ncbi:MAG: nucleotidyltransferase domain-containing protein [Armatimonadetes bacterium]|nr:nucleotidyltransferase domain-containing protein [Armatimonadota bacterium]
MLLESEKIISEIKRHVQDRPQVAVAYLMGSYAGGTATPLSDVDVGIGLYPSLCPNTDDALDLAAALEYSLTEALFPGYDPKPWAEWLFTPVEVVVLNAPHTLSSLPWMLAGALPVHTPDPSFKVELEKLAFRHGRPTPEEATIAAWRLKATWIVRTARGQVFASYEGILRTCLNLAHRAVVRLGLPVPEERQQLPRVLHRAGIITRRAASFITEAINILCHDRVNFQAWEYLHHNLHLLADYALQVEDALERTVKQQRPAR